MITQRQEDRAAGYVMETSRVRAKNDRKSFMFCYFLHGAERVRCEETLEHQVGCESRSPHCKKNARMYWQVFYFSYFLLLRKLQSDHVGWGDCRHFEIGGLVFQTGLDVRGWWPDRSHLVKGQGLGCNPGRKWRS